MIKLAFFVKYLFSNKYRVIIAFSSKIDYLCLRVIQLCEVWGIRLIDFRNQFVTHPFLSLILQFVNQRDSLNGNNRKIVTCFLCHISVRFSISNATKRQSAGYPPGREKAVDTEWFHSYKNAPARLPADSSGVCRKQSEAFRPRRLHFVQRYE